MLVDMRNATMIMYMLCSRRHWSKMQTLKRFCYNQTTFAWERSLWVYLSDNNSKAEHTTNSFDSQMFTTPSKSVSIKHLLNIFLNFEVQWFEMGYFKHIANMVGLYIVLSKVY